MSQISFFDGSQPLKITKPIRLIECFAGYGSQALALKYLGVDFEHWKIAEWAVKSIQAYKDMHFTDDNTDYSAEYSKEWLIDYLFAKGISADYNKPMTREQISRMGEDKIRTVYNNIIATHNLVSVCGVSGKDLEITDTDKYDYILTYSFPCQDLSQAGLSKGMAKGSGTRSGLLWEIERILDECEELPQILLMENVPQVIGEKNQDAFRDWFLKLESLGYKSWYTIMNGKDYEIPQNRERCFMVSCLGDYYYDFPNLKPLKLRLKDMLEAEVDEKYYLSNKTVEMFVKHTEEKQAQGCGFKFEPTDGEGVGKCISTRAGSITDDNFIKDYNEPHFYDYYNKTEISGEYCGTLTTGTAHNGSGTFLVQEPCTTRGSQVASALRASMHKQGSRNIRENIEHGLGYEGVIEPNCRIRKLTPKECFRLMGVKDEDFERVARNQSNSSLYHLAGDSIITNCLMAIFKEML